jgi:hypothetical protein
MTIHEKIQAFYQKLAEASNEIGVVIFCDRMWVFDPKSGDSATMEIRPMGNGDQQSETVQ